MNLLIDAHVFDEAHQGTRTYIKGLYLELIKQLPEVKFFFVASNLGTLEREIGIHPNVYFIRLKQKKYLRLLIEIPWIIYKNEITVAHFQYVSPPLKNCKQIVTTHDILFKDFPQFFPFKYRFVKNILFKFSAKRADWLFTVSEYSKKRIAFHYRIPNKRIGITSNGVATEFFQSNDFTKATNVKLKYKLDRYILFVSRVEPRKNHIFLLKAFAELKLWEKGYQLVFVGKRDFEFQELDLYISNSSKDCGSNVIQIEKASQEELIGLYKGASLFVYPSIAEGFGIPPIEAIAAKIPTLCSNSTAMSDFVFLEDDLFDPFDLDEFKTKLIRKIMSVSSNEELNAKAELVLEKYSWAESARNFIDFVKLNSK